MAAFGQVRHGFLRFSKQSIADRYELCNKKIDKSDGEARMTLKEYRKRQKMTQEQMGVLLGISQAHMSELESGAKKPSYELMLAAYRLSRGRVPFASWFASDVSRESADV